jgi:hypothetical protein
MTLSCATYRQTHVLAIEKRAPDAACTLSALNRGAQLRRERSAKLGNPHGGLMVVVNW